MDRRDRALGALTGLAVGDALGMPTQTLPRDQILAAGGVRGFAPAPEDHPLAHGLPAGRVTDDTEQALLLADVLIDGGGRVDPVVLAERLGRWEDDVRARGSLDLLGPSTKAAVQAVRQGVPPEFAGATGTTNGAAMRIAPVGIAVEPLPLRALVDKVEAACLVSHHTSIAIAGAAAVAAAVSGALEGMSPAASVALAIDAAQEGATRGRWVAGAEVAARLLWAADLALQDDGAATDGVVALIGTSLATQESVPAAFAMLLLHPDDPWAACCAAAALGGDTDTIAAMTGAMAGALHGVDAFPADAVALLHRTNELDLDRRVDALLALR